MTRKARFMTVGVLCSMAAPLALVASPASADLVEVNESFEMMQSRTNVCTGEGVDLDGRVHVLVRVTPNADGSFHVKQHTNTQGVQGIGMTSGDGYTFSEGMNSIGEVDVAAGGTAHLVGHEEFIHHGETNPGFPGAPDDLHVHFNTTVSVDAAGEPIVTVTSRISCR